MATDSRSTRESISLGSQEYFEYFCQPCSKDGDNLEAEAYCTDCEEFLCQECYRIHRKPTALQHHVLVQGESIKQYDPPLTPADHNDTSCYQCDKHRGKVIEYFCTVHEKLACTACLMMSHRTCDPALFIPDEAIDITDSEEYKNLMQTLDVIKTNAADVKASFQVKSWTADDVYSKAIQDYDTFRNDVIGALDDYKKELIKTAESIRDADNERVKSKLTSTETTAEKINKFQAELQNLETTKRFSNLYIATKQAGEKIRSLKAELKDVQTDGNITQYTFVPNDQTKQLLVTKEGIGSIRQVLSAKETNHSPRTPTLGRNKVARRSENRKSDDRSDATPFDQLKKTQTRQFHGSVEDVRSFKQEIIAKQDNQDMHTCSCTCTTCVASANLDQPKKKKPGFGAVSKWNSRRKAKKQE